jgi:hypothetical protein
LHIKEYIIFWLNISLHFRQRRKKILRLKNTSFIAKHFFTFQTTKREDFAFEEGRNDPRDGAQAEEEDGGCQTRQRTGESRFAKFLRIRRSGKPG